MKTLRIFGTALMAILLCVSLGSCNEEYDDSVLTDRIDDLEDRVSQLEELCKQMNTNISALQTIVSALQNNDYITSIIPITKDGVEIGYTIKFLNSQSITIYHGKNGEDGKDGEDGEDGKDGTNGKDGVTPIIGVKKHTDGIYYWTINDEWLLDDNGNKVKAQGTDGMDGENGEDGNNGTDGEDGVTPKLKIQDGYWYVSYNDGTTWIMLGKATGENGADGSNGEDGDSMFKDIIIENGNVTFILNNGIQFTIPTSSSSHLTVEVKEAGTLREILTAEQKRDLISLSVKGYINASDIRTIEYQLQNLQTLDLSNSYYVDVTHLSFDRMDVVNGKLKEITLPKPMQHDEYGAIMNVALKYYPFLEKITVSSDTTIIDINARDAEYIYSIDSLILREGITLAKERSCCANAPTVVIPSTMKQVHNRVFGWGTDEQIIDLSTVICKALVPPSVGDWGYYYPDGSDVAQYCFANYSENSYYTGSAWNYADECTLLVPAQSLDLYKEDKYWGNFGTILPLE